MQIVNLNNGKSLDIDIPGIESFGIEDNTLTVKVEGTETDVEQFDLNEIQESLF